MTIEPVATPTRVDRRRERTRAALIAAAQEFLADGRTAVSIQQITDAADVGFGSFYNHFESKEALFEAAVEAVLQVYGAALDGLVAGYDDPAEVFAVSFRLTGRLQRQIPAMVRVLLNEGVGILLRDEGLRPRAIHDIEGAVAAGRFDIEDSDLAVMSAGGALLGLLQLLDANPDADAGALTDMMTARVLRGFGMTKAAAEKLCSRPLPELPEI
ncbi:TetR/AcrR family transcriptional regulator [Nocardioides immobilis]|uniref:TetR/AcrR family transcriptional regulator n=1 Tax=Nocardioides immobilis TaxID=2049295 RepID=A0A417XSV8_9ACTN|nr:TetR/AcrR family transcriptional regulator [Nocardioides immobilis]RHW23406.1 TetR/AcrR family transcriptional regulator [Nocardioides immobilis]